MVKLLLVHSSVRCHLSFRTAYMRHCNDNGEESDPFPASGSLIVPVSCGSLLKNPVVASGYCIKIYMVLHHSSVCF